MNLVSLLSGPPRTYGAQHTSSTCATQTTGMCRQSTTRTYDPSYSCHATLPSGPPRTSGAQHVLRTSHVSELWDSEIWYVSPEHDAHLRSALTEPCDVTLWPAPHVRRALQDPLRCPEADWNVSPSHALQVRAFVFESGEIFWPAAHVVCVSHIGRRWPLAPWYVWAGHARQARACVLESAAMY